MTDHTDLIKRLREEAIIKPGRSNRLDHINPDGPEAAGVIEAQAAHIAELEAAPTWQSMENAPDDGTIILTDEGCVFWEGHRWWLCAPTWRDGQPDPSRYSCADNGAFDVIPSIWTRHPLNPLPPAPQEGE